MPSLFLGQALAQGVQGFQQGQQHTSQMQTADLQRQQMQQNIKNQQIEAGQRQETTRIANEQQQNILDEQEQFQRKQQQIGLKKGISTQGFSNYFEHIVDGNPEQAVTSFNKAMSQDPELKQMYGDISTINPIGDKNAMGRFLQETDPTFDVDTLDEEMMSQIYNSGAFVKGQDGQIIDVQGASVITGELDNLTSQARQTMNDNISALRGAFTDKSIVKSGRRDAMQQKDDQMALVKSLEEKVATMPHGEKRDELQSQLDTEKDFLTKMTTGVREAAEGKEGRDVKKIRAKIDTYREEDPNSFSTSNLSELRADQEKLHKDVGPVGTKRADRLGKEMEGAQRVINSVNKWLNEFEDRLVGPEADLDKGFVANPVQWLRSKFGEGELSKEQVQQSIDTIKANTKAGLIITDFIKTTTGLAMTEAERRTYNEIITGGAGADENSIISAITAFRDGRMEVNDTNAKQIIDVSPYDAMKFRQYEPVTSKGRQEPQKEAPTEEKQPLPTIEKTKIPTFEQAREKFPSLTQEGYEKWLASRGGE